MLVVGAGISGALIADLLTEAGSEVAIVDRRRRPVLGSTPASTALLEYEIDTPLCMLERKIGKGKAIRAWRRSRLALDALAARTRALDIDCDLDQHDNLYLAGNLLDAGGLAREGEARCLAGFETTVLDRRVLRERFGIRRDAALLAYDDFGADPRRLALGYLAAAAGRGALLHAPCEVRAVDSKRTVVVATTAEGLTIRCAHLVFATGYELPDGVPRKGHRIVSTYALATRPQPRRLWPERVSVWEASEPYLYLRATPDGRVICGGEDEEFSDEERRDRRLPAKTRAISRKLGKLFPALDTTPDFAWAGSFGTSTTGLPTIGRVPGMRNCWAVFGYGGNGITYSRIAAEIVRAGIVGDRDPDADLYSFR